MSAKPIVDGVFHGLQKLIDLIRENRDPCAAYAEARDAAEQAERAYEAHGTLKLRRLMFKARRKRNKLRAKCERAKARR